MARAIPWPTLDTPDGASAAVRHTCLPPVFFLSTNTISLVITLHTYPIIWCKGSSARQWITVIGPQTIAKRHTLWWCETRLENLAKHMVINHHAAFKRHSLPHFQNFCPAVVLQSSTTVYQNFQLWIFFMLSNAPMIQDSTNWPWTVSTNIQQICYDLQENHRHVN